MSTGAVNPFTPNQPTLVATPGAAANSLLNILPCESVLVYNSGSVLAFIAFANTQNPYGATPIISGALPIPPGTMMLIGIPGVIGVGSVPISQIALLAAATGAGAIYVTPGLGTQR